MAAITTGGAFIVQTTVAITIVASGTGAIDGTGGATDRGFVNLSYNGFYPPYRSFGGFSGFGGSHGGALIGGLVLGSLLNQATANRPTTEVVYRNPPVRTRTLISTRQPTRSRSVISSSRPRSTLINQNGRRLLRDIEGNCFERTRNTAGEELRVQLDPAECAF